MVLLSVSVTIGQADEEVSITKLNPNSTATPEPVSESVNGRVLAPIDTPTPTLLPEQVFKDGSFKIIITAAGDMTIGGDVRKRGDSIFVKE